jgi:hypothetical protein
MFVVVCKHLQIAFLYKPTPRTQNKKQENPFFNRCKSIKRILVFKAIATTGLGASNAKVHKLIQIKKISNQQWCNV